MRKYSIEFSFESIFSVAFFAFLVKDSPDARFTFGSTFFTRFFSFILLLLQNDSNWHSSKMKRKPPQEEKRESSTLSKAMTTRRIARQRNISKERNIYVIYSRKKQIEQATTVIRLFWCFLCANASKMPDYVIFHERLSNK